MSDTPVPNDLTCPLCGGTSFRHEQERSEGRWGFSTHVINLMVCENCSFILHFYGHSSIWDFS
jgi:uncharacterized protein